MRTPLALIATAIFVFTPVIASADEVTEAISEGLSHYKKGDLSSAASQLDYAATLVRQQKAKTITAVFPAPLGGWTADDASSESAGAMMMGGGITANRAYYKGDDQSLTIELIMDSAIIQSMIPMLSNPSMIAMSGGKLKKIQGLNAMIKQDNGEIEVVLITKSSAMITLKGDGASEEDVMAYAKAMDLTKLE